MEFRVFGGELGNLVKIFDKMVDDVKFDVNKEDGFVKIDVMNIERTMLSSFTVETDIESGGNFGVRVKDLKMVAKMFKKADVTFKSVEEGFVLVTDGKKKIKIPEVEVGYEVPELPEFETTTELIVNGNEFKQILSDVKQITDAVKIKGNKFIAVSSNHEYEYEVDEASGEDEIIVGVSLLEVVKNLGAKEYKFRFGADTPLIVEAETDFVKALFIIAPRVE